MPLNHGYGVQVARALAERGLPPTPRALPSPGGPTLGLAMVGWQPEGAAGACCGREAPLRLALGLSGEASPNGSRPAASMAAGAPADTFDLQLLAEAIGRNGTTVKRRDMLALAPTQRHRSSRAKRSLGTPRLRSH